MDEVDALRETIKLQLELIQLQIQHTNQRIDGLISVLKWVIGLVVPILTVILQTAIGEFIK
jgi:hypothetical protein